MFRNDLGSELAHSEDLFGLNPNIRGLSLRTASWLVDENAGVWESKTFAFGAGSQEQCAHRSALAHADRSHVRADKLHSVVNSHARRNRAARRIDVHIDVFFRILSFEKE